MSYIQEYYKNSTEGYLLYHIYSGVLTNTHRYYKNGVECNSSALKGCVEIKKEKYEKELKKIKKSLIVEIASSPEEIEVSVGRYYMSPKTDYLFKVIALNRKKNYCCIVDQKERHETVKFDYLNNQLIKGKIILQKQ